MESTVVLPVCLCISLYSAYFHSTPSFDASIYRIYSFICNRYWFCSNKTKCSPKTLTYTLEHRRTHSLSSQGQFSTCVYLFYASVHLQYDHSGTCSFIFVQQIIRFCRRTATLLLFGCVFVCLFDLSSLRSPKLNKFCLSLSLSLSVARLLLLARFLERVKLHAWVECVYVIAQH